MAKLDELVPNARVEGLDPEGAVTITAATMYGDTAVNLHWQTVSGKAANNLIYEEQARELKLVQDTLPWTFTASSEDLLLASEAWRIHYAHLFDPYLAVHNSDVDPLPHQISAVYGHMLRQSPLRFLLADDPGAGKTIMTGLLLKELLARGELTRCLIVCPGNLALQWQDELYRKFNLNFEIITRDRINNAGTGNAFDEIDFAIARMDQLARFEDLQQKLQVTEWDLIACDEAHKMSAPVFGGEAHPTLRYNLGKMLSRITHNFLLLTATPHNGKDEDFQQFLALIDEDRFGRFSKTAIQGNNLADIMRRMVKEELLKFDGAPLFPDRIPFTRSYTLSPAEKELYEAVTAYVQSEFNRADRLAKKKSVTVGFALTVLQRRLASSPEAIYRSLERRRKRLTEQLPRFNESSLSTMRMAENIEDEEDISIEELENLENEVAAQATAASSKAELEMEIATLKKLEELALEVRSSGTDRKWEDLSRLLQESKNMYDSNGAREKLIIFTEHRDTLNYLASRIRTLLGNEEAVITIQGGMSRDQRYNAEERFRQDQNALVLVATDAAGEGVNLQRAHLMVNYDLPWNPNRLEQRFGRIHRIGQTHTCMLWNLVAADTREGEVFERLFQKLEKQRVTLGGKVFDVLGKIFKDEPLYRLLIQAIRQDNQNKTLPAVSERITSMFDNAMQLIREDALSTEIMDAAMVIEMAEEMERRSSRRLQPYYIQDFFCKAFRKLGGQIDCRKTGFYAIPHVPAILRNRLQTRKNMPVLRSYSQVCFDKTRKKGRNDVDLLCPGHPLLDALVDVTRERYGKLLKEGAVLIDPNDFSDEPALLLYLETVIEDGAFEANGQPHELARRIQFVRLNASGFAESAGIAPYLDYLPPKPEELQAALEYAKELPWLNQDIEQKAISHAIFHTVPPFLNEVRSYRLNVLEKTARSIKQRIQAELDNQYAMAAKYRERLNAGESSMHLNIINAENRANDLLERRKRRLEKIEREKSINAKPPIIRGGALIIPRGLIYKLLPETAPPNIAADALLRKKTEMAALKAVLQIEEELGYIAKDVSNEKRGYDINSLIPPAMRQQNGICQRFIEVKGRQKGAAEVILTKNEIIFGLHSPKNYILALVELDGDVAEVTYLKTPFSTLPQNSVTNQAHNIDSLHNDSQVILTRKVNLHDIAKKAD